MHYRKYKLIRKKEISDFTKAKLYKAVDTTKLYQVVNNTNIYK